MQINNGGVVLAKTVVEGATKTDLIATFDKYLTNLDSSWGYITPIELNEALTEGQCNTLFLVDLRDIDSYKRGHIKGAINIPLQQLFQKENLRKLPRDKRIVIYCYLGHTSSQVLPMLRLLRYDVVSLKFGMGISPVKGVSVAGWNNFGFETVSGDKPGNECPKCGMINCTCNV